MATKKPLAGLFSIPAGLRRASLSIWIDADLEARPVLVLELHHAIDQRIYGEIRAEPDISAGVPFGTALAHDDIAGDDFLAPELLDAAVLRIAVATVAR